MGRLHQAVDFDLVIAGAGFAGLACARAAAMRGLRVAVLEGQAQAGARIRTTGILVKEAAAALDLPAALTRRLDTVRLYGPGMSSVDLRSPGYSFVATDTAGLVRWLAFEARRAGARIYYDRPFTGAVRVDGRLHLDGIECTTRYLVGADGARSRVARAFGLGRNRRFLVGIEAEIEGTADVEAVLHCFIDRRLAPGYIGWVVPGVGVTQVGLACEQGHRPDLPGFMEKVRGIARLDGRPALGRRAGLIPAGGPVAPFATDSVCLVGDAAGLVSPMTGGGLHPALHFGRLTAQVVADHLQAGGPEPGRVLARELPRYPLKRIGRALMRLGFPDPIADLLLQSRPSRALATRIFFHSRLGGPALGPSRYFRPATRRAEAC